jgi:hypothetical protein
MGKSVPLQNHAWKAGTRAIVPKAITTGLKEYVDAESESIGGDRDSNAAAKGDLHEKVGGSLIELRILDYQGVIASARVRRQLEGACAVIPSP